MICNFNRESIITEIIKDDKEINPAITPTKDEEDKITYPIVLMQDL